MSCLSINNNMTDAVDTTVRSCHWLLTINNPTGVDDAEFKEAKALGWTCIGQKEMGENGTPHYQVYLKTQQVRWSAVKKVFKRAHIEATKSRGAAIAYVQKSETRVGDLPEVNDKVVMGPSHLWVLYADWYNDNFHLDYVPNKLDTFDTFVREMICAGWRGIEHMATNAQIRKSVRLYGSSLVKRDTPRTETI